MIPKSVCELFGFLERSYPLLGVRRLLSPVSHSDLTCDLLDPLGYLARPTVQTCWPSHWHSMAIRLPAIQEAPDQGA